MSASLSNSLLVECLVLSIFLLVFGFGLSVNGFPHAGNDLGYLSNFEFGVVALDGLIDLPSIHKERR